jgi:hypothetical protein
MKTALRPHHSVSSPTTLVSDHVIRTSADISRIKKYQVQYACPEAQIKPLLLQESGRILATTLPTQPFLFHRISFAGIHNPSFASSTSRTSSEDVPQMSSTFSSFRSKNAFHWRQDIGTWQKSRNTNCASANGYTYHFVHLSFQAFPV